jgi:hypothetical protein
MAGEPVTASKPADSFSVWILIERLCGKGDDGQVVLHPIVLNRQMRKLARAEHLL